MNLFGFQSSEMETVQVLEVVARADMDFIQISQGAFRHNFLNLPFKTYPIKNIILFTNSLQALDTSHYLFDFSI